MNHDRLQAVQVDQALEDVPHPPLHHFPTDHLHFLHELFQGARPQNFGDENDFVPVFALFVDPSAAELEDVLVLERVQQTNLAGREEKHRGQRSGFEKGR